MQLFSVVPFCDNKLSYMITVLYRVYVRVQPKMFIFKELTWFVFLCVIKE